MSQVLVPREETVEVREEVPQEVEPQQEAFAREEVVGFDNDINEVEILIPSLAVQGKSNMVVYSEDTNDLCDERGGEEGNDKDGDDDDDVEDNDVVEPILKDADVKTKSTAWQKYKKENFREELIMATLKIEEVKTLINGLAKKQETMEYTLMRMVRNMMKRAQQKSEAKEKATQNQLGRIEALLRQQVQASVPQSTEGPSDAEANFPPLPAATKGYVFVKQENKFLRPDIQEIKEDVRKIKSDIWKIKGHVQHTSTILLICSNWPLNLIYWQLLMQLCILLSKKLLMPKERKGDPLSILRAIEYQLIHQDNNIQPCLLLNKEVCLHQGQ